MEKVNIITISINKKLWYYTLDYYYLRECWRLERSLCPRIHHASYESYVVGPQKGVGTDHRSGYILVSGTGVRDVGWHWPREQPPLGVLAGAWKRRLRFVDTLARPGCRKKGRRGKTQYDPGRSRGSGVTVHEGFRLPVCWAVDSAVVVGHS